MYHHPLAAGSGMSCAPVRLAGPDAMSAFGERIAQILRPGDAIALFGDLGAGKTTLVRGILHGLGWSGDVASPTFPIMLGYEEPDIRIPAWHVDLYRIEEQDELEELGLDELRHGAVMLVEWPERMGDWLWPDCLRLEIEADGQDARLLTARCPPAWEGRWPTT